MTSFAGRLAVELTEGWAIKARPNQRLPEGDWSVFLLMAGRGFGKTRVLSETSNSWASSGLYHRQAIVAATAADARNVLVEGESGILATAFRLVPSAIPTDASAVAMAERCDWGAVLGERA